jgi:hypothetical protein
MDYYHDHYGIFKKSFWNSDYVSPNNIMLFHYPSDWFKAIAGPLNTEDEPFQRDCHQRLPLLDARTD